MYEIWKWFRYWSKQGKQIRWTSSINDDMKLNNTTFKGQTWNIKALKKHDRREKTNCDNPFLFTSHGSGSDLFDVTWVVNILPASDQSLSKIKMENQK